MSYLEGVTALVVEQGLGKAKAAILTRQLLSNGGSVVKALSENPTHILVGSNVRHSRLPHLLKIATLPGNVLVLRSDWLSACLVDGERVGHAQYVVQPEVSPHPSPVKTTPTPKSTPPAVVKPKSPPAIPPTDPGPASMTSPKVHI